MKYLGSFVKMSYLLGLPISILAAFIKIQHLGVYSYTANILLVIGIMFTFIFTFCAILEIHDSKRLDRREKFMWTIGLITMATLIGTIYVFSARKRIVFD